MARSISEKSNERNERRLFEKLFVVVAAVVVDGRFRRDTNQLLSLEFVQFVLQNVCVVLFAPRATPERRRARRARLRRLLQHRSADSAAAMSNAARCLCRAVSTKNDTRTATSAASSIAPVSTEQKCCFSCDDE